MKRNLKEYLFCKNILVKEAATTEENAFAVLFTLAKKFDIQVTQGRELVQQDMIALASEVLGYYVPEGFYRGFPHSVRNLTKEQLLFDQLVHYTITYGFGDFSNPGHSVFEQDFQRLAFDEETEPKEFVVLTEAEAAERLKEFVDAMLQNSRPLSEQQYDVLKTYIGTYSYKIEKCACKDTAIRLLLDTRDPEYARFLALADVIPFVDRLNYQVYENENIKKLNLKNADRKLISRVIHVAFQKGRRNVRDCFEKKALWSGLLHHIHFRTEDEDLKQFVALMRSKENRSAYSAFERAMLNSDIAAAVKALREGKGSGALLRNLNYIVSRCKSEQEVQMLLDSIGESKPIILIQLLMQYTNYREEGGRVFKFTRYNKMCVHNETKEEQAKRRTLLSTARVKMLTAAIYQQLRKMLHGKLGKVYIAPEMYNMAIPLQEGSSTGGYGVMPKGSRIPLPDAKKLRAFTYWERVNDIDLSVFSMTEDGEQSEYSWRTMYGKNGGALVFSGDQTSGYEGGSEFYDVDVDAFKKANPEARYLVFCNNVYSGTNFDQCLCKAGYMLRDVEDSGEVFEPKTVKSSFVINCASTFAYLFGFDLKTRDFIWLNAARDSQARVAGETPMAFLLDLLRSVTVFNVGMLFEMLATEVVPDAAEADIVLSDGEVSAKEGAEIVRSYEFEKIAPYLG